MIYLTFGIIALVLISSYLALFIIERQRPLRVPSVGLKMRWFPNMIFTMCSFLISAIIFGPLVYLAIIYTQKYHIGILNYFNIKGIYYYVIGFLGLDLINYYWHRLNHEVSFLWRFHNIHHIDPSLDVTTSLRFHIIEIIFTAIFKIFQIFIIGSNFSLFIAYELIYQLNTFFHHSNVKLSISLEKIFTIIWVTPRMHGIHHSNYKNESFSNWGIVFTFWDRLHKTLKLNIPQKSIVIGVPAYSVSDNVVSKLMRIPFQKQPEYWTLHEKPHLIRSLLIYKKETDLEE